MTDRPILFSAAMVRALIDGRKIMTRRLAGSYKPVYPGADDLQWKPSPWQKVSVGDRLWVREAWADVHPLAVQEDRYSQIGQAGIPGPPSVEYRTIYRADGEPLQVWRTPEHPYFTLAGPADAISAKHPAVCSNYTRDGNAIYWGTPIHMPRWASRITLAVTETKIERLQDITPDDARAEGLEAITKDGHLVKYGIPDRDGLPGTDNLGWPWHEWRMSPVDAFQSLWTRLHGPGSWDANPEVVALTFTVALRNIDAEEAA